MSFRWQKYKCWRAGGLLGWNDEVEGLLLEGPAVLGEWIVMVLPQWMGVGVELLAKWLFFKIPLLISVSVLCSNRSLQPLLLSCQCFRGGCLCQAHWQWHKRGELLFKWLVSLVVLWDSTTKHHKPKALQPIQCSRALLRRAVYPGGIGGVRKPQGALLTFLVPLQDQRHQGMHWIILGCAGHPDWDELKADGRFGLPGKFCPINSSQNENSSFKQNI